MPIKAQAPLEVEPSVPIRLSIGNIYKEPEARTLTIEVGQSEYMKKVALEEAEKAKQAELARQRWLASQRANLTVKPTVTSVASTPIRRNYNFVAGQCTAYVASRFPVTWSGNANRWASNARAQGYRVDKNPQAGSVIQLAEGYVGHVAYIERVDKSFIYIREQNFYGPYIVNARTISRSYSLIVAVIHPN